ncbi:hypothetical protein AQJ43_03105 [Streptomyces avermitilis]|uniref:Uncharacterized protein n=1 Tax=Streptomyces avermitilis TaxID=33903 RepID=A0A4D4LPY6_STRAX|nr:MULTISPECIES: hypothetical protein [Streptomyces]KUN56599.1 hypothetical protein AQJ43_03105 [Streptomyces avermitilis]OOV32674.1 hypothetical protein SM007_07670 [Streptomyces avermitilis]BBJ51301.1 hypothetical protein SAVMC3_39300 [Streptomyces avermitilis]GDY63342.1 hypothetical protein SAV14893_027350 [Streptomyces avermitilis]GDY85460.1 hypothetical protein SAVCW2_46590 [Streptomyces avermitilis]
MAQTPGVHLRRPGGAPAGGRPRGAELDSGLLAGAVDGRRGLFLDGNWYLAADGTCVKIKRPRLTDKDGARPSSAQLLWLTSVIPFPGTDTVLGAGHVQVNQAGDPMEKAVVVPLRR